MTSPPRRGSAESAGALTTRMPSRVPKYSPSSGLRVTRSRSHQESPKQNPNPRSVVANGGISGPISSPRAIIGPSPPRQIMGFDSSVTMLAVLVSLPRRYSTRTVSPGSRSPTSSMSLWPGPDSSSSSVDTPPSDVPLKRVMMSPALRPAFSAGPPGVTPSILAPSRSLSALAAVLTSTPMRARLSPMVNEKARVSGRGALRGRAGSCPTSTGTIVTAASTARTALRIMVVVLLEGPSQAHVPGAGDPNLYKLLHQLHPLPPQIHQLRLACRTGVEIGQLSIYLRDLVFEPRGDFRLAAAHDPALRIEGLQRRLELRRLPFGLGQVLGDAAVAEHRAEDHQADQRSRGGETVPRPAAPA